MSKANAMDQERSEPKSQGLAEGMSYLEGDLAQDLDPNTRVVSLENIINSLRVYQHYNTGEIMILVNETLSNETRNVEDYSEWSSVYLHANNSKYLKSFAFPATVQSRMTEVTTHASPKGSTTPMVAFPNDEVANLEIVNEEKLETDRAPLFNEFTLSMQKLKDRNLSEEPLEDVAVVYKNQAMNEAFEPFQYSPSIRHSQHSAEAKNSIGTDVGDAKFAGVRAESKGPLPQAEPRAAKASHDPTRTVAECGGDDDDDHDNNDDDGDITAAAPTGGGARCKEECPYCHQRVHVRSSESSLEDRILHRSSSPFPSPVQVITATSRGSEFKGCKSKTIPEIDQESFDRHVTQCGFVFNVLPRFRHINADIQSAWLNLKKSNELGMAKTLVRAMRSFEKKQALNNRVLNLVNLLLGLGMASEQAGEHFAIAKARNPDNSPDVALVEEKLETIETEVHDLLLQLRQLESSMTRDGDPALAGDPLLDVDSDDERLDGDVDAVDEEKKKAYDKSNCREERNKIKMYIEILELCKRKVRAKWKVLRSQPHKQIGINDFECIRLIGKGSFAHVYLVRRKKDGCMYALKAISKDLLTNDELLCWGMDREKNINNLLNEHLISRTTTKYRSSAFVNLKGAFRLPKWCCLVSEICAGGDCQSLLNRVGYLKEETVKLIIAEVVSAVLWLHKHGVLHRDIKPDNIYITRSGHVKLGDFGMCTKRKRDSGDTKTHSLSTSFASGTGNAGVNQSSTDVVKSLKQSAPGGLTPSLASASKDGRGSFASNSDSKDEVSGAWQLGSRPPSSTGLNTSGMNEFDSKLWEEPLGQVGGLWDDDSRDSVSLARPERSLGAGGGSSSEAGEDSYVQAGKGQNDKNVGRRRVSSSEIKSASSCDTSGTSIYYQRFDEKQYYYTGLGNYHYQSPECITGMGYDHSEDWWAVGVMTFHFLAGITPFDAREHSNYSLEAVAEKDRIVTAQILWENIPEENVISPMCHDFIQRMLQENPSQRLFCQIPNSQVQEHHFFDDINFSTLFTGKGPLGLKLHGPNDFPYFDETLQGSTPSPWAMAADERESNDKNAHIVPRAGQKEDIFINFKDICNF